MEGYRLIVPVFPIIYLLVQEGIIWCHDNLQSFSGNSRKDTDRIKKAFIGIILFFVLIGAIKSIPSRYRIYIRANGYYNSHIKLGEWFNTYAKSGDKIALMDIGLIGHMNMDKDILDITGLTDKTIAHSEGIFLKKDYAVDYIFRQQPKYIVLVSNKKMQVVGNNVILDPNIFWIYIEKKIVGTEYFRQNYKLHLMFEHNYPDLALKYYLNLFVYNKSS